jgi:hypothetical protein
VTPEDGSADLIRALNNRLIALSFHIREYYWIDMKKLRYTDTKQKNILMMPLTSSTYTLIRFPHGLLNGYHLKGVTLLETCSQPTWTFGSFNWEIYGQ